MASSWSIVRAYRFRQAQGDPAFQWTPHSSAQATERRPRPSRTVHVAGGTAAATREAYRAASTASYASAARLFSADSWSQGARLAASQAR